MNGFQRLDLAERIERAMNSLEVRVGHRDAMLELCDCLDDEALERVLEHLIDTLEDGMA